MDEIQLNDKIKEICSQVYENNKHLDEAEDSPNNRFIYNLAEMIGEALQLYEETNSNQNQS